MTMGNWLAAQLEAIAKAQQEAKAELKPKGFNPNQPGQPRDGSSTHRVLQVFHARPGQFLTHGQIMVLTESTKSQVDWALIYLRTQGVIEAFADPRRKVSYKRYRLAVDFSSAKKTI